MKGGVVLALVNLAFSLFLVSIKKNSRFWWKNVLTLGPIISGTKCDRDKLIIFAEREGQSECVAV